MPQGPPLLLALASTRAMGLSNGLIPAPPPPLCGHAEPEDLVNGNGSSTWKEAWKVLMHGHVDDMEASAAHMDACSAACVA